MDYVIVRHARVAPQKLIYRMVKRSIDIAICLLILPFALPVMALCALAIRLDSVGPVFFVQDRIGKGGRLFRMVKFRTMQSDFDDHQSRNYMKAYVRGNLDCSGNGEEIYKPVSAICVTRVGRILRKTSLDELPQIINVLRGEMSVVGPRPNVTWEVEEYRPWHHERFEVLPGITGLAQVRGRSCIDFISLVRYDIEYVEKQSLALDFKILWWTALAIVKGKGAS
jgi:lipopolysaccharide/colanic/teichoic acid biosynthesis glycosyltransferase